MISNKKKYSSILCLYLLQLLLSAISEMVMILLWSWGAWVMRGGCFEGVCEEVEDVFVSVLGNGV